MIASAALSLGWLIGAAAVLFMLSLACSRVIKLGFPPIGRSVEVVPGVVLHIIDRPCGDETAPPLPVIVLIHGASGNARDSDEALGKGLSKFARVLSFDRPGHGWSGRGDMHEVGAPEMQARMIAQALDGLHIDQAIIIGHSLGAAVACALAVECPHRVAGVIALAPATHPWPGSGGISWHNEVAALPIIGPIFAALLPAPLGLMLMPLVLPSVFAPNAVPKDYARLAGVYLALCPKAFRANAIDVVGLKAHVSRLSQRYPDIRAPMLVIAGSADTIVSNALHAERLAREVPDCTLVQLPGIGHMVNWSAGAEVERLIVDFACGIQAKKDKSLTPPV